MCRCWRAIIHKNGVTSRRDIHRQPSTQTLKLKPAQKPDHCVGCKELEFDLKPCYQCEHENELAPEMRLPSTWGMRPFLLPLLVRINQLRPYLSAGPKRKEYGLVCDVCGKDVKGWFYYGLSRGEPLHLHPCCAKLPFKRTDNGSLVLDLKENITSVCLACGNEGFSNEIRSWA